jgi:hypothetical protein
VQFLSDLADSLPRRHFAEDLELSIR